MKNDIFYSVYKIDNAKGYKIWTSVIESDEREKI